MTAMALFLVSETEKEFYLSYLRCAQRQKEDASREVAGTVDDLPDHLLCIRDGATNCMKD